MQHCSSLLKSLWGLLPKYLTFLKSNKTEINWDAFGCYRKWCPKNKLSLQATTSSGISHLRKTHLKWCEAVMWTLFWSLKSFVGFCFHDVKKEFFPNDQYHYNFTVIFYVEHIFKNIENGSRHILALFEAISSKLCSIELSVYLLLWCSKYNLKCFCKLFSRSNILVNLYIYSCIFPIL